MSAWGYFIPNCFSKKGKEANFCLLFCDRGLQRALLPQWHYASSLILQPPEKDRKTYWIVMKSIITFGAGSKFYHWGLKSPIALTIYLEVLTFPYRSENYWRCALRKYALLNSNSHEIWKALLLASHQFLPEIAFQAMKFYWMVIILSWVLVWPCCRNGSLLTTAMGTHGLTGIRGGHNQFSFVPALLSVPVLTGQQATGQVPDQRRYLLQRWRPVRSTLCSLLRKCVLGYQNVFIRNGNGHI